MSEMVEKVARALCKADGDPADTWSDWVSHACAVIAAMRKPTEAMMIAAFEADDSGDAMSLIRNEWQAMIDAALAEQSSTSK